MSLLTEHIVQTATGLAEGEVLMPKELLHLGSRAAVDQALSRLAREGKLMRVARGAYVAPVVGQFGPRPPSTTKTIESLAQKSGETVVAHGSAAANALGLTTQVPMREIYITSGRTRQLRFGNRVVELKHGPRWQLALGDTPAGAVVRAVAWLGPNHARESLEKARRRMEPSEWKTLVRRRAALPTWMAKVVGEVSKQ